MAKKYLLYIHHSEFEAEAKKSELVNDLLARHYGAGTEKVRLSAEKVINQIEGQELCEHFAGRGFCKRSKCKFSQFNPKNRL